MNRIVMPLPGTVEDPRYPDSDGRFMGDTEYHNVAMTLAYEAIKDHFAESDDVYVASNLVMYFRAGDPKSRRDPDILVAKGVLGKHMRRSYRFWEEKVVPCTLFEIASRKTWRKDVGEKRELYARIGIREYFVFDPENRYFSPPLQGFRTVKGRSLPMRWTRHGLVSKELGLGLNIDHDTIRFTDLMSGGQILTRRERLELARLRIELQDRQTQELAQEIEMLKQRIAELEG